MSAGPAAAVGQSCTAHDMTSASPKETKKRIASIDLFRVYAVFAVICIHSRPFYGVSDALEALVNQATRFAVPFFFIASGYFFARKLLAGVPPGELFAKYARRLGTIFLAWSLVYALYPREFLKALILRRGDAGIHVLLSNITENFKWVADHPIAFLFQGTAEHLWFIVSLGLGIAILAALARLRLERAIFYVAVPLYLVGLLGGSYSPTPLGLRLPFNPLNGPFQSALFVAIGWRLAQRRSKPPLGFGIGCVLIGYLLHLAEASFLFRAYGSPLTSHYQLIGTIPFGLGVMLIALARPDLGEAQKLPAWGKYTLGIYASHVLVLDMIRPLMFVLPLIVWSAVCPVLAYVVSLLMSLGLSRFRFARGIVA